MRIIISTIVGGCVTGELCPPKLEANTGQVKPANFAVYISPMFLQCSHMHSIIISCIYYYIIPLFVHYCHIYVHTYTACGTHNQLLLSLHKFNFEFAVFTHLYIERESDSETTPAHNTCLIEILSSLWECVIILCGFISGVTGPVPPHK